MHKQQTLNTFKLILCSLIATFLLAGPVFYQSAHALEVNDMNPTSWFSSDDKRAEKKAKEAYDAAQEELQEANISLQVAKKQLEAAETRQQAAQLQADELKSALDKISTPAHSNKKAVATSQPVKKAASDPKQEDDGSKLNPANWFKPDSEDSVKTASAETKASKNKDKASEAKSLAAVIKTEKGDIAIELYPDQAPITVANFVNLIRTGFYDQPGMKFHRVVPGFVIQTGDPTGTGAGGSKERIPLEVKNKLSHDEAGIVAMARGPSPHSATSQFYITLAKQTNLDGKYAIFGKVIKGLDVISNINQGDKMYGATLVDVSTVEPDPKPEKDNKWTSWLN